MPFVMVMVAVIGAMLGAGCEKQKIENPQEASQVAQQNPQQQQQSDTRLLSLENTSWKLVAFVEDNVSRQPESWPVVSYPIPFLLEFHQDSISGVTYTNMIHGRFSFDNERNTIDIYVGLVTYAYECNDGVSYIDRLNESSTYNIDGDTLNIYVNEKNYLVFERINPPSFLIGEWAVNASMSNVTNHNYKDTLVFTTSGTIEKHSILAGMRYYLLNDTTIIFEDTNRTYKKNFRYYPPNGIMFYNFWDNTVLNYIKNVYYEKVEL